MNYNESHSKGTLVCGWCSYDANPLDTERCQRCGKPLKVTSAPTSARPSRSSSLLGMVVILLCLGGASYFFWQQVRSFTNISSLNTSLDVRSYELMKEVQNVPDGVFSYGGTLSFTPINASGIHKAMTQAHPQFRLHYTEPRDGQPSQAKGIAMLLNGELSFAQSAVPLTSEDYWKARQRGVALEEIAVAINAPVFFTHPDVTITELSVNQLRDIYTGKLTNWKQIGGPDLDIVPIARDPKTDNTLLEVLLGSGAATLSSNVKFSPDYQDSIRQVNSTPGAIAFGGIGSIFGERTIRPLALAAADSQKYVSPLLEDGKQINKTAIQNGTYPITQRLFIVLRRDGTPDEKAGLAYVNMLLSQEGQRFIEKSDLLPLR